MSVVLRLVIDAWLLTYLSTCSKLFETISTISRLGLLLRCFTPTSTNDMDY